jgi:hypothetical protein
MGRTYKRLRRGMFSQAKTRDELEIGGGAERTYRSAEGLAPRPSRSQTEGSAWGVGVNSHGQLGDGTNVINLVEERNSLFEFRRLTKAYIRASPDASFPQYWPAEQDVELFAPMERLEETKALLDSAGKGDSNRARNALAVRNERTADAVWIVVDINRCASNQIAADIPQNNLRTLMMKSDVSDLC